MRRISGLLLVFALMIAIPCMMPFDGFGHRTQAVAEETQVEMAEVPEVRFAGNGVVNSRVVAAFAMALVAAMPALTYGKQTQFSVNA